MRVLLPLGLAFKLCAEGFEQGSVLGIEGIREGPQRFWALDAIAGMDELLDGDGGDEGGHHQPPQWRFLLDEEALDIEALGFQGSEHLLDDPASAVEIG